MDERLKPLLVCPRCKRGLRWDPQHAELVCDAERIVFPVRDGVPVLLVEEARALAPGEGEG